MNHDEKINFLAQSIQKARTVMQKVETGEVKPTGKLRPITEDDVDRLLDPNNMEDVISESQMLQRKNSTMKNMSKSKMPEAILKSFQENPIIDPTAPIGMESIMQEITEKVAPKKANTTPYTENPIIETKTPAIDTKLIEYIIKKTVEETLEQVNKKVSIDENIQIKIGNKTFGGKINTLNEIKK